jgi:hypothetical protein
MTILDHERLDVYKSALELVAINDEIVSGLPKGRAYLMNVRRLSMLAAD